MNDQKAINSISILVVILWATNKLYQLEGQSMLVLNGIVILVQVYSRPCKYFIIIDCCHVVDYFTVNIVNYLLIKIYLTLFLLQ